MTKNFVAMAVLKLRDEGKLQLDRPASYYLPELRRLRMAGARTPSVYRQANVDDDDWATRRQPMGRSADGARERRTGKIVGAGLSFSNAPNVAF